MLEKYDMQITRYVMIIIANSYQIFPPNRKALASSVFLNRETRCLQCDFPKYYHALVIDKKKVLMITTNDVMN